MFTPRGWQIEAREAFRRYDTDGKHAMIVAATGTGKTKLGHYIAVEYLERGERVLWLADQKELVAQPLDALNECWPQFRGGVVRSTVDQHDAQIVYASKQTLLMPGRLDRVLRAGRFSLVVVDESHRSASKGWAKLIADVSGPETRVLGLTATPDREDTKKLSDTWTIIYTYGVLDGIADEVLVQPYVVLDKVPNLDLSRVAETAGDFDPNELERELTRAHIVEHTVDAIKKTHLAESLPFRDGTAYFSPVGKGILVYTITVRQAHETVEALRAAGLNAHTVWGEMPDTVRRKLLARFRDGGIDCLVSPAALTTGVDLPYAKVAVLARPTRSWALFVQILGRILRPSEGEDKALLLDLCGASKEHSIVAAPVLVDGIDCESSPDGQHRYLEIVGTNEGRCSHCGVICKCMRNAGGHLFKEGRCRHCGALQCPESPDLQHGWVPWEGNKRKCLHCAMEIPDPLGLMAERFAPKKEPVAWKLLRTPGRVYAAHLGSLGLLFNVERPDGWRPWLYTPGRLTPLAPRSVDARLSRALTDDVARRAAKRKGAFGLMENNTQMRRACLEAEKVARDLKLWECDAS